jgi:hypothetical protein
MVRERAVEEDSLHGVLGAFDARTWLRRWCESLDDLPHLLLQFLHLLHVLIVHGGHEDQA